MTNTLVTPEIIIVESDTVACDGGNGGLGHPLVYLPFGDKAEIQCPYCSRIFRLAEGAKSGHNH